MMHHKDNSSETRRDFRSLFFVAMLSTGLSACGGGDGGGEPGPGPGPNPGGNTPPTADAGSNITVDELAEAKLAGIGSDEDGDELVYTWTQTDGPNVTLNDAGTASARFMAPEVAADTELTFRMTVADPDGEEASDTVVVTVKQVNVAPEANAAVQGDIQYELSTVTLDAGNSADHDGDDLTYSWEQTAGPTVTLADEDTATPSFETGRISGYEPFAFEVTVSDGALSATDTVEFFARELNRVIMTGNLDDEDRDGGIWSVALATGERVQLTSERGNVSLFAASADRRFVAFSMDTDTVDLSGSYSVYVAEIGVENSARLIFDATTRFDDTDARDDVGDGTIEWMAWSPNDDKLAFVAKQNSLGGRATASQKNLMVWDQSDDTTVDLTGHVFVDGDLNDIADVDLVVTGRGVQWSPSGSHLAYIERTRNDASPLTGAVDRLLTRVPDAASASIDVSAAAFDGDRLDNNDLYVNGIINPTADGNPDTDLDRDMVGEGTLVEGNDANPAFAWSAQGRLYFIAAASFIDRSDAVYDLHSVDSDGGNYVQMTSIGVAETAGCSVTDISRDCISDSDVVSASWSPSGDRIAFRAAQASDTGVLIWREWIADADGAEAHIEVQPVADAAVLSTGEYSWSPDGSFLGYIYEKPGDTVVPVMTPHVGSYELEIGRSRELAVAGAALIGNFIGWHDNNIIAEVDPIATGHAIYSLPASGEIASIIFSFLEYENAQPTFMISPTAENLAFVMDDRVNPTDIGISGTAAGSTAVSVAGPGGYNGWGAWSPDGNMFVGYNWEDDHGSLQAASRDGESLSTTVAGDILAGNDGVWNFYVIGPTSQEE